MHVCGARAVGRGDALAVFCLLSTRFACPVALSAHPSSPLCAPRRPPVQGTCPVVLVRVWGVQGCREAGTPPRRAGVLRHISRHAHINASCLHARLHLPAPPLPSAQYLKNPKKVCALQSCAPHHCCDCMPLVPVPLPAVHQGHQDDLRRPEEGGRPQQPHRLPEGVHRISTPGMPPGSRVSVGPASMHSLPGAGLPLTLPMHAFAHAATLPCGASSWSAWRLPGQPLLSPGPLCAGPSVPAAASRHGRSRRNARRLRSTCTRGLT